MRAKCIPSWTVFFSPFSFAHTLALHVLHRHSIVRGGSFQKRTSPRCFSLVSCAKLWGAAEPDGMGPTGASSGFPPARAVTADSTQKKEEGGFLFPSRLSLRFPYGLLPNPYLGVFVFAHGVMPATLPVRIPGPRACSRFPPQPRSRIRNWVAPTSSDPN